MGSRRVDISTDRLRLNDSGAPIFGGALLCLVLGLILTVVMNIVFGAGDGVGEEGSSPGAAVVAGHGAEEGNHGAAGEGGAHHGPRGYVTTWSLRHSYLLNFMFFLSLSLGGLFFVILQHITRAGWSVVVRRIGEAIARNLLLMAVLAIPVVTGLDSLYAWVHPDPTDHLIAGKSVWLNPTAFTLRLVLYFVLWVGLALFYHRTSVKQDETGDVELTHRMQRWSPLALLVFVISLTLAAFDLLMSLDAHWFSTIFGVYFFGGCVMSFFAFLALCTYWLQRLGRIEKVVTAEHYQDIGKMCFGFVVFWAYIAFSQYMLTWYANIPEETEWYLRRQQSSSWMAASFLLLFGHFVIPFFFLVSRHVKRAKGAFAVGAVWVLLMQWFDMYYLIMPQVSENGVELHLQDVSLFLAMGGVYIGSLLVTLRRHSLIPERDPRLPESLAFENY